MKKIITLGLWAAGMAACNNSSPDIRSADSAMKAAADTIKASTDTVIRKMDSGIKAVADTATTKIRAAEDSLKKKVKK
jgi:hypothetical protein